MAPGKCKDSAASDILVQRVTVTAIFHTLLPSWLEEEKSTEESAWKAFTSQTVNGIHTLAARTQAPSRPHVTARQARKGDRFLTLRKHCINLVMKICLQPSSHIQNSFKPFPRRPSPNSIQLSMGSVWSLFFSIHPDVACLHPAASKLNAVVK